MTIRKSHTPEIWLKVPSCKAFNLAILISLFALTSCTFLQNSLEYVESVYANDSPFIVTEYNSVTEEKPKLKLKGYEDIDLKLSTDMFYIRKTWKLSDFMLDSGKKFKESEERRVARTEMLTLH